jgi:hypothetical protein
MEFTMNTQILKDEIKIQLGPIEPDLELSEMAQSFLAMFHFQLQGSAYMRNALLECFHPRSAIPFRPSITIISIHGESCV